MCPSDSEAVDMFRELDLLTDMDEALVQRIGALEAVIIAARVALTLGRPEQAKEILEGRPDDIYQATLADAWEEGAVDYVNWHESNPGRHGGVPSDPPMNPHRNYP